MNERAVGITAAIVAGGSSSRFGGIPKGLERVGGKRIVDRVIEAVHAVASDVFIVSNADDAPHWTANVRVVRDIRGERGSLVGIHTALATSAGPTLVLAWDMPFVSTDLLRVLVNRSLAERFAVIPESDSGLEPFCALYQRECLPIIERAIDERDLRVTALPSRFPSFTRIPVADVRAIGEPQRLFFNVNLADDLRRAEELERSANGSR